MPGAGLPGVPSTGAVPDRGGDRGYHGGGRGEQQASEQGCIRFEGESPFAEDGCWNRVTRAYKPFVEGGVYIGRRLTIRGERCFTTEPGVRGALDVEPRLSKLRVPSMSCCPCTWRGAEDRDCGHTKPVQATATALAGVTTSPHTPNGGASRVAWAIERDWNRRVMCFSGEGF